MSDPADSGTRTASPRARQPYRALVVTASNRAAAGVYADTGGPIIAGALTELGFTVQGPLVVPDGDPVEQALRDGVAASYAVILTTGGTGVSPTDRTPRPPAASWTRRSPASPRRSAPRAPARSPPPRSRAASRASRAGP